MNNYANGHASQPAHRGHALTKFQFEPQPAAQRIIDGFVADFLARCPQAAALAQRMRDETGTRFKDWVDYIEVPRTAEMRARLLEVGFSHRPQPGASECFVHEGAMFPTVVLGGGTMRLGIKVDFVADFLAVWQMDVPVIGEPLSQLRLARVFTGREAEMWVVERHGYRGFEPPAPDAELSVKSVKHFEALRKWRRDAGSDEQGFANLNGVLDAAIDDLGRDWACDLFFASEREYWQRRNRAAQVQYARQAKLGLGWANHDHHTYRSSRETFTKLIAVQEKLGLHAREAFYAGAEAEWGAQVMENPVCGITTFNDVDLSPEELMGDFAHDPGVLPRRDRLGTVGLWCGLHGEAMLEAGMHHLECQFDHHALVEQLARDGGIKTMAPFTTFPFLRQAFTEGERWQVSSARVERLLQRGVITREQAEMFKRDGVIGSHLENLERNDGFKGFNQQGVSDIIARTDPRRQAVMHGAGA